MSGAPERFHADQLAGLDEPVRRYFAHAIREGAALVSEVRLRMTGRIKVAAWLPFSAEETCDGRSFEWRARVGLGPLTVLSVVDRYRDGAGRTAGRLFGRLPLFAAEDDDTVRSAAGRAAIEGIWSPSGLLPHHGASWRAAADDLIVGRVSVPPERPELRLAIDERGALLHAGIARWGNAGRRSHAYIPCGGRVHAERRFGDLVLPSHLTVSWWFGTPREQPFLEARILEAAPG
jgi:hypothetical protein